MKPKSKKDHYTVECENRNQTIKVMNYIHSDEDDSWSHWRFVTNNPLKSGINDTNVYDYPVISFEEWSKLPDDEFVLPEKWCIKEREIIGYKLIKPRYKEALKSLSMYKAVNIEYLNTDDNLCNYVIFELNQAGVLDLWFEPVYKEEKVKLKSGVELSQQDIEEVKQILNLK